MLSCSNALQQHWYDSQDAATQSWYIMQRVYNKKHVQELAVSISRHLQ